ncbi:hypothetical protein K3495_g4124 [Podosphaera aphanis]|nr:hypothetical protein K3495_g4124 [Podosphaera aphanis]
MGLPFEMKNIHAPSVSSGPTTRLGHADSCQTNGLTFTELQAKKNNLEAEIRALSSVLDSHNVDMKTSLLTPDGFPRADIDVAQIRTTRARITYLVNDLKSLMSVIERHIHAHFAKISANESRSSESVTKEEHSLSSQPAPDNIQPPLTLPFAKVGSVVEHGPADSAGLQSGDLIRSFGFVNASNNDGLKRLSECVNGNIGHDISVKVSRPLSGGRIQELDLVLKPSQNWGGRGLLGCHVVPY